MKTWCRSFAIAFAMYSRIPMPRIEWESRSMRYALCFFPLVGAVNGISLYLWLLFCAHFGISQVPAATVAVVLPVAVTGGIHLDGFCDTVDALASHQPASRKLEILKDPHIGAFALIGCCVYFLLQFGAWAQYRFRPETAWIIALGFVLSRSMSGFSVVTFRCAKTSGLAAGFSNAAQKNVVRAAMAGYAFVSAAAMLYLVPLTGGAAVLGAAVVFIWYRRLSMKEFGGITGDLAGWSLQVCELVMLFAVVVMGEWK